MPSRVKLQSAKSAPSAKEARLFQSRSFSTQKLRQSKRKIYANSGTSQIMRKLRATKWDVGKGKAIDKSQLFRMTLSPQHLLSFARTKSIRASRIYPLRRT